MDSKDRAMVAKRTSKGQAVGITAEASYHEYLAAVVVDGKRLGSGRVVPAPKGAPVPYVITIGRTMVGLTADEAQAVQAMLADAYQADSVMVARVALAAAMDAYRDLGYARSGVIDRMERQALRAHDTSIGYDPEPLRAELARASAAIEAYAQEHPEVLAELARRSDEAIASDLWR